MTIKRYCDCCGYETPKTYTAERLSFSTVIQNKIVRVQVMAGVGEGWNGGDLCLNCLFAALDTQRTKDSP